MPPRHTFCALSISHNAAVLSSEVDRRYLLPGKNRTDEMIEVWPCRHDSYRQSSVNEQAWPYAMLQENEVAVVMETWWRRCYAYIATEQVHEAVPAPTVRPVALSTRRTQPSVVPAASMDESAE